MITVIIPAYNAEKTICNCVESVLNQNREAEIILVDDGSTDATCRSVEAYSSHIQILRLSHGGVSSARNAGLAAANGDWVVFLDSDDALLPDALATLERYMSPDVDAVCGGICRGNEKRSSGSKAVAYLVGHDLINFVLADPTNYLTIHAWAFRNKQQMPSFDSSLRIGEDSDWVLRYLYTAGKAAFVSAPVYRYTVSNDSTVHKWREDQGADYLKMIEKISLGAAEKERNLPLFVLTNYLLILTHVVFHPANPGTRKKQFKTAQELRENALISDAFEKAKLSNLTCAKRLVLACLKRNWTGPAYIAIKIRQRKNRKVAM